MTVRAFEPPCWLFLGFLKPLAPQRRNLKHEKIDPEGMIPTSRC